MKEAKSTKSRKVRVVSNMSYSLVCTTQIYLVLLLFVKSSNELLTIIMFYNHKTPSQGKAGIHREKKIRFMLIWVKWRKYSIKRTHGGKCFFFFVLTRRRDEMRERWRNRFSQPTVSEAHHLSSRLPLIDITTILFSSIFMKHFIIRRSSSFYPLQLSPSALHRFFSWNREI